MNENDARSDLPVPRLDDRDLPIRVTRVGPRHEQASVHVTGWRNLVSQRHVRSLAVDSGRGDVWLATGGGVLHWWPDLDRFTRYSSEHGLPGNAVMAVAVDGDGRAWVASEFFGLSYLDHNVWHSYLALGETEMSCLTVDDAGQLWVGAVNGVYVINSPHRSPTLEIPFVGDRPRAMAVTDESDAWLCNARGLYHLNGIDWVCHSVQPGLLTLARQGENLWLGTMIGLIRIDLATGDEHHADTWPPGEVTALAPAAGAVWAAMHQRRGWQVGLATEVDWRPVGEQPLRWRVNDVASAGDGEVWIGTGAGLLRGGPVGVHFHLTDAPPDVIGLPYSGHPPATFSNMIQALAVQKLEDRCVLWIGTPRALFCLDLFTESWKRYAQRGVQDTRALGAGATSEDIWVASWTGGLYSLRNGIIRERCPNVPRPVLTLAEGPGSTRWAAGLGGLYQGNGQDWELTLPANKLPARGWVRAIAQNRPDRIWIGTSVGLFAYEPDPGTLKPMGGALGSVDVRSLVAIPHGDSEHLWVATGQGLYAGRPDGLEAMPGSEGRAVTALAWDSNAGVMWAGTDVGLLRLVDEGDGWEIASELTAQNSGLAADHVTALTLSTGESDETSLWVGTPCGLSCYTY